MEMYHAFVEVDAPAFTRDDKDLVEKLVEKLETFHGVPSSSPRGYRAVDVAFPSESLVQAAHSAAMIASAYLGKDPVALEVMTEKEFNAREGFVDVPELVSVTEAAQLLGVTRQAVLDRISRNTLPAEKVGNGWAIPRSAVTPS